jgi:hypothetical protein
VSWCPSLRCKCGQQLLAHLGPSTWCCHRSNSRHYKNEAKSVHSAQVLLFRVKFFYQSWFKHK